MLGWQTYPAYGRHAYIVQESVGAYMAILVLAIWRGRHYFWQIFTRLVVGQPNSEETPYRMAWIGIVLGLSFLILFGWWAGMSIAVSVTFFLFFFALSMAITRLRAEIGFPDHDAHFCGPVQMITSGVGTTNLTLGYPIETWSGQSGQSWLDLRQESSLLFGYCWIPATD
jgi:hypothetical protein